MVPVTKVPALPSHPTYYGKPETESVEQFEEVSMSDRAEKIGIVGAGSVGATIAYACIVRGVSKHISLFDRARTKVEAEVLDLNHGLMFVPMAKLDGSDARFGDVTLIYSSHDSEHNNAVVLKELLNQCLHPEATG
jgi:shikimate 5-dehydrogenase